MAQTQRTGLINLIFTGITGIIGSGWLFAPYIAAKLSGPYSLISWLIGFIFAAILALCYAEIGAMIPARGLMIHIARITNDEIVGYAWVILIFLSYSAMPAIETLAFVTYLNQISGHFLVNLNGTLSIYGYILSAMFIILFFILGINRIGLVLSLNSLLSSGKIIVPIVFSFVIIMYHFHSQNFSVVTGINPVIGISSSLTSAGIIFSCLGFRQILEMSGEAIHARHVAIAILISTFVSGLIYLLIQSAVIGFFSPTELTRGFSNILLLHDESAPIYAISIATGLFWLSLIVTTEAVLSPASTAFLSLITASRVYFAIINSSSSYFKILLKLNDVGAPVFSLLLVSLVSFVFLLPFPSWYLLVKYLTAASAISYSIGPLVLLQLRKSVPDYKRPFRLAHAHIVAPVGFAMATLIICFSGLDVQLYIFSTVTFIIAVVLLINKSSKLFAIFSRSYWMLIYFSSIIMITFCGPKDFGGDGFFGELTMILLAIILSFLTLFIAVRNCNSNSAVVNYIDNYII